MSLLDAKLKIIGKDSLLSIKYGQYFIKYVFNQAPAPANLALAPANSGACTG
jgi:hypothetical protein